MSSNITLTAGIRQNLLSLQETSAELTSTQQALATGDKVNSAAQNPSAYFTSQNLTNTANSLSSLLDQIGQGQQTIDAANNGLTGLTSLLEQALSTAQQAQQASSGTVSYGTITGSGSIGADSTQATGSTFSTSGLTAATLSSTSASDADLTGLTAGQTLVFQVGSGSAVTATFGTADSGATFADTTQLATYLTAQLGSAATVSDSSGTFTVTSNSVTSNVDAITGTGATGAAFSAPTSGAAGSTLTLTDQGGQNSTFYYVGGSATTTAADGTFNSLASLQAAINGAGNTSGEITANTGGTALTLTSAANNGITVGGTVGSALGFNTTQYLNNYNSSLSSLVSGNETLTVQVGSDTAHTITFGTGAGQVSTLAALNTQLGGFSDITATVTGGQVTLTPTSSDAVTVGGSANGTIGLATSTTPQATVGTPSSTRATLQQNYNELLTQIDQLAGDASYNGVNLLGGDNLTIDFNASGSSSLTISGVNFNAAGLGLSALNNNQFQENNQINNVIATLNSAITQVQTQTDTFGTNSGVINTRQTFETNMINTLQTGASNLVAADQNQESADLLTEQTQQQLEISALSIANQANQSVLKLFG
ncbi:MAG TPA: flagellin [Xanthobacteraceae bacterium]|nr:flagellin [Xanthobacteraceae bacterium]